MLPPSVRRAFRLALRRPDLVNSEIDDEIAFHLQERIDALVDRGWSLAEATAEASRRFGDPSTTRPALFTAAQHREHRLGALEWLEAARMDFRVAARQLRQSPTFAFGVIAAFALGIGANATMFGVIDRLLLRPPAQVTSPENVYTIVAPLAQSSVSFRAFADLRDNLSSVASVSAQSFPQQLSLGGGAESQMAQSTFVDAGYFRTLGTRPALGRMFSDDDARLPDGQPVAVIAYRVWQRQFNGDSTVVGREVVVASERVRVIGVAPEGFNGIDTHPLDLWLPLTLAPRILSYVGPTWATAENKWLVMFARAAPGIDPKRIASRTTTLRRVAEGQIPRGNPKITIELHSILPSRAEKFSPESKVASLLGGVSLLVLLIACSNVANLMLARAVRRRREIGIRMALGVSRVRLIAQLLTDSMLLSALGGVAAIAVATAGTAMMRSVLLDGFVWDGRLIDTRTVAFIACAVVFAGLLTGLAPVVVLLRRFDLSRAIGEGRQSGGVHRHRAISALVVTQTVLSAMLLIGAVLFVQSLANVRGVPLGMDLEHTVVVAFNAKTGQGPAAADAIFAGVRADVARVPGVSNAAIAEGIPFGWLLLTQVGAPDEPATNVAVKHNARMVSVSSSYFATIGTHITRGRAFDDSDDRPAGEWLAIVSATLAKTLWPGRDPVGRCLWLGADSMPCRRIVGVAEDVYDSAIRGDRADLPYLYVPLTQGRRNVAARVVLGRVAAPPADVIPRIRSALQGANPDVSLPEIWDMQSHFDPELRPWKLGATMFAVFGALALVLAALGLYSVIGYSVAQRTHEMGIRIALGARRSNILSLVGTQGAILAAIGIVISTGSAAILAPLVQPLLFQTPARSVAVYALVAAGMLVVACAASLIPAARAARVSPMSVIRSD